MLKYVSEISIINAKPRIGSTNNSSTDVVMNECAVVPIPDIGNELTNALCDNCGIVLHTTTPTNAPANDDLNVTVATKFIDDNVVEKPITIKPNTAIVIPYAANNVPDVDNGGYNVQPNPVITSIKCACNKINNDDT